MALQTKPYKGARDFYPEDKRIQKYMFNKLRQAVERFGYEEYDAPILEPLDIYLAKTGEEIVGEQTYTFTDRGDRQVAIRPEMTPSVSRMVADRRHKLTYPLRLYSIPNLWRYERPQRGRFREHWQLNVDLFGDDSINAELEMLSIADSIYLNFGADRSMYEIRVNSRALVDHLTKVVLGLDDNQGLKLAKLIDRMAKMEPSGFNQSMAEVIDDESKRNQLLAVLLVKDINDLPDELKSSAPAKELIDFISKAKNNLKISNIVYRPDIMRGFDYYTDIVFEVFDNHPDNNRSMMGGGRYDGLVGLFGVEPIPTIGFGLGDATLQNFLELHQLLPKLPPETDLAVLSIGDIQPKTEEIVSQLRSQGLNVATDYSERKLGNKIKWAETKGIKYILVLGENELNSNELTLKDLESGNEQLLPLDSIGNYLIEPGPV